MTTEINEAERWNHNIHYHPLALKAVPRDAQRALDIGCGEGMLARKLRQTVPSVLGIDLDQPSIDLAKEHDGAGIEYALGDFLTYPFETGSFDLVCTVATLHHMDAEAGLTRMRELLRPGGALVVIGLARSRLPADLPVELAGVVAHRFHALTKSNWNHPSPIMVPSGETTYTEMRRLAGRLLPGARYRRHLMWRYSLTWVKPV
jgi:2-polyprenyl-3-methyl-5-hydroxy-6-metoxy-1,4-benzoquinol methylase